MTATPTVMPVLRVVPNGTIDGRLRMTLIATPVADANGFPLDQWPSMVRAKIFETVPGPQGKPVEKVSIRLAQEPTETVSVVKAATLLQGDLSAIQPSLDSAWAAIVPNNGDDLWAKLLETIHRSLASQMFVNGLGQKPSPSDTGKPQADGSYKPQEALEPGQQLTLRAVLPVKHGDLALFLEFERAKRVCDLVDGRAPARQQRTEGAFDASSDDEGIVVNTVDEKAAKDAETGDQLNTLVAARKLAELEQALDALVAEREISAVDACKALLKPDLTTVGAPNEARQMALASHTAGTWEQAASNQTNTLLDRVLQVYQAVVSSPAWSRFFGFAFDIELDEYGLKAPWISVGEFPVTFNFNGTDRSVGRAWSAVDDDGWPRSDEKRGNIKNGLYLMGADCVPGDTLPRYDLITLDVRHATEAVVRPLAGPGAEVRGFLTAGMTLIDRRRAEDVRAQVIRTSDVKDKQEIELYAEDVVVGRRLDVGTMTDDGILWRALGSKLVTYGLRRDDVEGSDDFAAIESSLADAVLQPKGASGTRSLEEAIVSPSARLAPTPGGGTTDKDVFVDEAYATWTGAPMGVNTAPRTGSNETVLLPFLQLQSLPAARARLKALAPPLRYGRSYRFGMRAVFLGGRSRTIEDAVELYENKTQAYTYPRDPSADAQIPMRRFLRQEAIGAPIVLLPGSVLRAKIDEMDFGAVQSAVLRSLPEGYVEPGELPLEMKGRPYVPAKERITPDEIIRVFIPPQAALDMLLRARVFDDAKGRSGAALGGLRDIAFGIAEPLVTSRDTIAGQGSFPIALIDEQRAFGQSPTRRKLAPGWNTPPVGDRPSVRGAAIFIGRKAFKNLGGPPMTPRPYYPDPHARILVLRLRRRTDGAYVGPASKVLVYDAVSRYPDAMPTVVVIKKSASDTAQAAIGPATTIRTDGVTFTGKSGQRAQRVEVSLARGDDFDLEAFYLPGEDDSILARQFALTEMVGAYKLALERTGSAATHLIAAHITTGFFDVPSDDRLLELARDIRQFTCGEGKHLGAGGSVEELAGVCTMRVAHAVNRPLAAPTFLPSGLRIFRKSFDTSKNVQKFAVEPDFAGMPPANQSPGTEPRRKPSGGLMQITLAELEELKAADLQDVTGTHSFVLAGRIAFDRRTTSAIEVLAMCVSPRDVLLDDPTRRRPPKARVSGAWPKRTVVSDDNGNPIPAARRPAMDIDVYGFETIDMGTGAVRLHRSEVTLLRIDNIAAPGAGPLASAEPGASEDVIDLSLAHIAAQLGRRVTNAEGETLFSASQLHVFPDSKARRLRLRLRAVSRFGPDFETAPRWTGADGNAQPVVRLRQALVPAEQSLESAPIEDPASYLALDEPNDEPANSVQVATDGSNASLWLPSSSRPAKCAALSPVPVFRFTSGTKGTIEDSIERISGVRIYLERGWFSAGEEEQLGVVMLPSGKSAEGGDAFMPDDHYGPIGPFISRWGGDPIRQDYAPLATGLSVDSFLSPPKLVPDVVVPVQIPKPPGAPDNISVLEAADLLIYQPRFDVDREQWFVDLDIQAAEAPNLFVRFGLVRYQKHSIHTILCASEPVIVWTQLLPARTLSGTIEATTVVAPATGSQPTVMVKVTATVTGPSYEGRRIPERPPGLFQDEKRNAKAKTEKDNAGREDPLGRLHRPTMRFRLMHESGDLGALRRVTMGVKDVPFGPGKHAEKTAPSTLMNSHARSSCTFDLKEKDIEALGPGIIYIYAEETETFMPATYANEPALVEDIFSPATFVASGARFAARLDLRGMPVPYGNFK